jgi:NADPH2:quinone reductase
MKAAKISSLDGPAAVTVDEVAEPVAGSGEIVVEVSAAGVAFPDVLQTRGLYQMKPALPFVPGGEVAGMIREIGPDVPSHLHVGQRVAAFSILGGFAEQVAVDHRQVFLIPDDMSYESAACLPMNFFTVDFALHHRGRMKPGETLLVHGAAGGIGSAGCQMGRGMGATVVAVVSSEAKGELARRSGAHHVVLADGFKDTVTAAVGKVDVILDPVGGDRVTDSLRLLGPEGRWLVVGFTGGEIPTVRVNRLLLNNIDAVGVGWGAYWANRPEYLAEQWQRILAILVEHQIEPVIGRVIPLERIADALIGMDERGALGKTVVAIR